MNKVTLACKETVNDVGQISCNLSHPKPVWELAMPPISIFRVERSIKKRTTNRVSPEDVHTSTVKKSVATI